MRTPEHVLQAAYEALNRPVVASCCHSQQCRSTHRGMTPHELHAEAAGLIYWCERNLTPLQMAYVQVRYGRDGSGFDLLEYYVAIALGTGLYPRKGVESLIRAYCGDKIGLREIRKAMSCGMLKAMTYRTRAYDALDKIHWQVMDSIYRQGK
jgi:hypothetical protein